MKIELTTPLKTEELKKLKAGDDVYITGYIYTARDAAHKRLFQLLEEGKELPFDPKGAIIYYVGPTPAKPGKPIGSAGPTTAFRMDVFTPKLLEAGIKGIIAKGKRTQEVKDSLVKNGATYFAAIGGAAALIARCVKTSEIIAYEDLGAEAIRKLYVEDFPATVINDVYGNDLYQIGRKKYLESIDKE